MAPSPLRLEEPLLQALADRFRLFSFAPDTPLYARGSLCSEVLILISGQVRPQRGRCFEQHGQQVGS